MYRVFVPAAPTETIPKGAALLEAGRGRAMMFHDPREPFAERCAKAISYGRIIALPEDCTEVGFYDEYAGELNPTPRGLHVLESWIGQRAYRGDLEARDNRTNRRSQARRLMMQGRSAEAYRLDRRFGF